MLSLILIALLFGIAALWNPNTQLTHMIGIVLLIGSFFGTLLLGVVGIILARRAKKDGYVGKVAEAGFVCAMTGAVGIGFLLVIALFFLLLLALGYRG